MKFVKTGVPKHLRGEKDENGLYKEAVNTKPIVVENSSTGTKQGLYTDGSGYIEENQKFWEQ